MRSRRRKAEREPDTEKVVRLFCVHIEKKTGPAAAVKEESSGAPEGQDSAGKSSSTAPLEERMVSGRGTRQSSFPRGMRRLSFSVFIRQKKSGGASGSCSGMGVSPGRRESLRLSPFRTQWSDRPAGHTGPAAADGLCQGLGGLRRGFWSVVSVCLNKCGKNSVQAHGAVEIQAADRGDGKAGAGQPDPPLDGLAVIGGPWDGRCLRSQ